MAVFLRELSRNSKALVIWTVVMVLICVFLMTFFPTVSEQADELDQLMQQYPEELVSAFNMDRLKMSDPIGFFGTEAYLFMTLFGSVYAMILFSGFLAREESEKTVEFLLSKPHNRAGILTSKLLAGVFCITVFNAVYGAANFILMESYVPGEYGQKELLLLIIAPYIMHLAFGFLAAMISVFIPRTRSVYPVSIGIVLGSYFLSIASTLTENGEFLKYFSFFKYIDAADIVENLGFSTIYSVLFIVCSVVFIGIAYFFYIRKDIHA